MFTSVLEDVTAPWRDELKELKESLRNCRHDFISDCVEQADPLAPLAINTCTIIDEDEEAPTSDDDTTNSAVSKKVSDKQKQLQKRKRIEKDMGVMKKRRYVLGYHHNKLNVLPRNFKYPSMPVFTCISMISLAMWREIFLLLAP